MASFVGRERGRDQDLLVERGVGTWQALLVERGVEIRLCWEKEG